MSYNHNENSSYVTNLVSAARQNHKERYTVVQGDNMKVNVMCVPMCGDVGTEVHENEDQLVTVVSGNATVKLGNTRGTADCVRRLSAGDSVFIPAGVWHNICNTGSGQLKLISVYAYASEGCSMHNTNVGSVETTSCGCTQTSGNRVQAATSDRGNVFNASDYTWQNNTRTRDEGCGCAIDSGC